jgi:radical SAM superfamily enzyme YgiQ (UPF0313 family)
VWLIIFKKYVSKPATRDQLEAARHPAPGCFASVTETLEDGNYIYCTIEPVTETEYQLLNGKIGEIRPDLIGISMTTPTAVASAHVTEHIKREFPGVPIIWGGIHPTINPDLCIPLTDMVCIGDGEHVVLDLTEDPERTDVPSVWRRKNGSVIRNPIRPLEQNLDVFPFPSWGDNECLIEWDRINPLPASNRTYFSGIYFTMTARGCPFSCSYCYNHARRAWHKGERYVRRRSVGHVLAELGQRRRDFDVPAIHFMDDIFVKDRDWIEEFADKYPGRVGLPFGCYAHPDLSDETMIRRLAEVGLRYIILGIESGSKYIMEQVYNRRCSFEKVIELANWATKYGVALIYELLSHCEYESEADCLETLNLLLRLPPTYVTKVSGVAVFPSMRIANLDLPKHCLPETTHEFWSLLYILTHYREIPRETFLDLTKDEYLKARPEILHGIAKALKQMETRERASRAEVDRLRAECNDASLRGLLRYTKRLIGRLLPRRLADSIRAVLARRGAAETQH